MPPTAANPIAVKLDTDTRDRIARLAALRKHSAHALMREAI